MVRLAIDLLRRVSLEIMPVIEHRGRVPQVNALGVGSGPILVFGIDISPLSLARMVWKRKLIIFFVWAVVTAATVIHVQRLRAVYTTSALIILDSQKIPERYVSATVNTDVQDRFATISQQIVSNSRLKTIIEQFDLYREQRKTHFPEEVLEMMRNNISITPEKTVTGTRPGAFRISYRGDNPVVLAQVVNAIADIYIEENLKTREEQAGGTTEFINSQVDAAKKKLDELEAIVSTYKVAHNGELPQQEAVLNGILNRLQVELEANRDGINRAQTSKMTLDHSLSVADQSLKLQLRPAEPVANVFVAPGIVTGPEPKQRPSDALRTELKTLRARYSDEHPEVIQLLNRLARAEAVEAATMEAPSLRSTAATTTTEPVPVRTRNPVEDLPETRQLRERVALLRTQIGIVDRELESRRTEQKRIFGDIQSFQARMNRLPIREQEMAKITRDYEIAKSNYRSLLDKKISADMAADMERRQKAERFKIGDPARVPEVPTSPNRMSLRAIGSTMGLVLGLLLGLGAEIRARAFLGEWQVPAGMPVIARVPTITHSSADASFPTKRRWFRRSEALSS